MQMTRLGGLEKPAETQMQRMNKLTMVYNSKVLLSNKKEWSTRYLYIPIHGIIIHNSQKVETTQVSMNRWINKQNVVYISNGMLFSLKKEGNPVTYAPT